MSQEFYLADEQYGKLDGTVGVNKDVLYFKQARSGYNGKADKDHVKNYATEYQQFKTAHPEYKLPWGDEADYVGVKSLAPGETLHSAVVAAPGVETKSEA